VRSLPTPRSAADHGRSNDTWIAACCLTFDLPRATLNLGDFQDFVDHEGLVLITA
jgi:toxin FitB